MVPHNPTLAVYGIRHHGPGSARAVQRALATNPPDIVLIEGPPEADAIMWLAGEPDMQPPVTLLGYAPEHPERAVFFPFASFSPEWVALTWACGHQVPARFIDLPWSAMADEEELDEEDRALLGAKKKKERR